MIQAVAFHSQARDLPIAPMVGSHGDHQMTLEESRWTVFPRVELSHYT